MINLKDKVVLVTGADGGIGNATCKILAKEGAKLAIGSINEKGIRVLYEELTSIGAQCVYKTVDCTDENSVKEFVNFALQEYGAPQMLLNLAGLSITGEIEDMDITDYEKIMDVNIKGTFLPCKYFLKNVESNNDNLIINIGSMASKNANATAPLYCTAKAGVAMLSKAMALQAKSKNVRVTTLNPGGTSTGFWGNRKVPHDKFMRPEDVAESIIFVMTRNPGVMVSDLSFESFDLYKSK